MNKPNPFIEVFMSLVKWFLIVLLVNNLIWAGVLYVILNGSEYSNTISLDDSFENEITQGVTNG